MNNGSENEEDGWYGGWGHGPVVRVNQVPAQAAASVPQISHRSGDSFACAICLDSWTSDGPHRVVSLKCGHLFGLSCIQRSLTQRQNCPTCKSDSRLEDVILVFLDTSERTRLKQRLEEKEAQVHRQKDLLTQSGDAIDNLFSERNELKEKVAGLQQELEYMRNECQRLEQRLDGNNGRITVNVCFRGGDNGTKELKCQIQTKDKMDGLMTDVALKVGMPVARLEFRLKGRRILDKETAERVELQHEDVIHVYVRRQTVTPTPSSPDEQSNIGTRPHVTSRPDDDGWN